MSKIPIGENTFKPRKNMFLLLALVFSVGIFIGDAVHSKELFAASFSLALLFAMIGTIFFLLTFKTELTIADDGVRHKTLFKTKELAWADITYVSHRYVWHGKSGHNELEFTAINPKKSIRIITDYYKRSQLKEIATLITQKANCTVAEKVVMMSEGIFPWYVF